MKNAAEYSRGYQAGIKKNAKDLESVQSDLRQLKLSAESKNERVYMKSLELALKHCGGWGIGGKPIKNAQGYCQLAKIFADNSIAEMDS